ncbi:MAG: transcriptional regulator [Herbinix sp.]|jgi:transcriptional regulator with XRE-family HTH domain|nr:transcriptional regulator [Herbinix sp.]
MLDIKKVGIKITALRKSIGLSQEKLAEMLIISPQAISKWENGHTLPETTLLPLLSQIFRCSIDDIIMPAYSFDEKIELEKPTLLEQQAEYIAKCVLQKMDSKIVSNEIIGLGIDNETIINAVHKAYPNIGYCTITKGKPVKKDGTSIISITISASQKTLKLFEKIYNKNDAELYRLNFIKDFTKAIPRIYHIDLDKKVVLIDDLTEHYIQGYDFNENNENGEIIRQNYNAILSAAAKLHAGFWEDSESFEKIGLDWRLESKENILAHISCMEKDYIKYRKSEETGKIPKVWMNFENNIDTIKLDCFQNAIQYLREEYPKLIEERFHLGKNITIIHGDLHPGQTFVSKTEDRTIKFVGLQAVRMGLCTEDLAMLLALHIEADKMKAIPLLDYYYQCLCEKVKDYPYEVFINDYKISIAENMFFTLRLINKGIYDFTMRDKAIKAFETFVLDDTPIDLR